MRLLLDEQLSPRLVRILNDVFPDAAHVHDLGLGSADDRTVFQSARDGLRTIVTKDGDFDDLVMTLGPPPRVIWLRTGNGRTSDVAALLRFHARAIAEFEVDTEATVLVLSGEASSS